VPSNVTKASMHKGLIFQTTTHLVNKSYHQKEQQNMVTLYRELSILIKCGLNWQKGIALYIHYYENFKY
jgi:hypothetical protein